MKINNRRWLMLLICGGQLVCLLAGLWWFGAWVNDNLLTRLREQILSDNEQAARHAAALVQRLNPRELRPGTPDWDRVQSLIEKTRLRNDGFLSVIETKEGRLICHPDMRGNPSLLSFRLGQCALEGPGLGQRIMDAPDDTAAQGWAALPDDMHLIAGVRVPALDIIVLAHQRERAITQVITHLKASLWSAGAVIALALTILTGGLTSLIVRRYEHTLAELNSGLEEQVQRRSRSLMRTRDAVIFGLARLAESRHEDTGAHLERMREYVELLARELAKADPRLDEQTVNTIILASSLHDIGKVGVPDFVLLKPGKLTARERAIMKRHTIVGCDCLLAIKRRLGEDDFLTTACQIALSHHERWDGKGYPFGIKGDQIPLPARIVALADVYDALTSDRVYKCALSHEQARKIILQGAGEHFDPLIVEAFLKIERDFARISSETRNLSPLKSAA